MATNDHDIEPDPAQDHHCPPSAAGAATPVKNLHAGASAKRKEERDSQARVHNMAEAINDLWVPDRRYGGVNKGVYVPPPKTGAMYGVMYGNRLGCPIGRKRLLKAYYGADELQ